MDLKEVEILGEDVKDHWYYRSKANARQRSVKAFEFNTILDVGAGSSFFSKTLLDNTPAKTSWCVDIGYEKEYDEQVGSKKIHYRTSVDNIDADLVLLMDVLEHVEDDLGLLSHYIDKVPKGARFLISVPAFQFLWSQHDVFVEHVRRYTLSEAESLVKKSRAKAP